MTILALEFSSDTRSVALRRDDLVFETVETGGGRRTAAFRMIETVLAEAKVEREQVEMIAVGLGPGSYTGVRAAIAIAQGWALARPVRLTGVSSALALAAQAQAEKILGRVNVVIDAQRGEIYLAGYQVSEARFDEVQPLAIISPTITRQDNGEVFVGPEVTKWFGSGNVVVPMASTVASLAARRPDATGKFEPIYLRETAFVKAPPSRIIP